MTFGAAIDAYIRDLRGQGRITSDRTERSYRSILAMHLADVQNRDPRLIGRDDVKRTLRRMEEGLRATNPARQTRRPKRQPTNVYRLTRREAASMLGAARPGRERRAIYLGICAGLRNAELRGLQGRHFQRPGFIHVSEDIAKGGRERWIPVLPDLTDVVDEIRWSVAVDEYVLPAQRWRDPPFNRSLRDYRTTPSSAQALYYLVQRVGERAGIAARIHPHLLRHAFGDHIARFAGMRNAQFLLGHAQVSTTETYVGQPTLDELAASVIGFGFGAIPGLYPPGHPITARKAPSGLEPESSRTRPVPGDSEDDEGDLPANLRAWIADDLPAKVALYAAHFRGLAA